MIYYIHRRRIPQQLEDTVQQQQQEEEEEHSHPHHRHRRRRQPIFHVSSPAYDETSLVENEMQLEMSDMPRSVTPEPTMNDLYLYSANDP